MWCATVIISFEKNERAVYHPCGETAFAMVLLHEEPPVVPSLAASRSLPSLAARTPSRSRSALSTPAGTLLSEQLLVHLHRAKQPQQHLAVATLPLHASGALGRRSLSNTQLPTIVGGLMRAQRAKFLDHNIARDDSKERCSIRPSPTH